MSPATYEQLRAALARDSYLFRYWSHSIRHVSAACAARFCVRADEVDRLIGNVKQANHNPAAPADRSDVPTGMGAAESPR
jgi:hypothetical protein